MSTALLDTIFQARRQRVRRAESQKPLAALKQQAAAQPPALDFSGALTRHFPAIIAEVKKGSPSRGVFKAAFDPLALAKAYAVGGAAAISVVTEPDFFGGDLEWVGHIKQTVALPILRKDFMFSEYQVWESRAAGADAVLLILAMLSDEEAAKLLYEAETAGLQCLVEVHDETEAARACRLDARLVGVNNRNLQTFEVDLQTSELLAPHLPPAAVHVAESGIHTQAECLRLARCGYGAFLVGEALVTSDDPALLLRSLRGADAAH